MERQAAPRELPGHLPPLRVAQRFCCVARAVGRQIAMWALCHTLAAQEVLAVAVLVATLALAALGLSQSAVLAPTERLARAGAVAVAAVAPPNRILQTRAMFLGMHQVAAAELDCAARERTARLERLAALASLAAAVVGGPAERTEGLGC